MAAELVQEPRFEAEANAEHDLEPLATAQNGATSSEAEEAKKRQRLESEETRQAQAEALTGSSQIRSAELYPRIAPESDGAVQPAAVTQLTPQTVPCSGPRSTGQQHMLPAAGAPSPAATEPAAVSLAGLPAPEGAAPHQPAGIALPQPASPTLPAPLPPLADFNKVTPKP